MVPRRRIRVGSRSQFKYDFCLSFAGEDRRQAKSVAKELVKAGQRVFYDMFESADLWGKDLYTHLDRIYEQSARFCLVFVSRSYKEKAWATHEQRSAQARAFRQSAEYILPVRLDDTKLPGLRATVGYVTYTEVGPKGIAELALQKIHAAQLSSPPHRNGNRSWTFLRWEVTIEIINGRGLASYQTDVVLKNIGSSPQVTGPLHSAWSGHGSPVSLRNLRCFDPGGRLRLDPDRSETTPSFVAFRAQPRSAIRPGQLWHYWWHVNWPGAYRHMTSEEHWYTYKGECDVDELLIRVVLPSQYKGTPTATITGYLGKYPPAPLIQTNGRASYVFAAGGVRDGEQIKVAFRLKRMKP